jgi:hypothetical protein
MNNWRQKLLWRNILIEEQELPVRDINWEIGYHAAEILTMELIGKLPDTIDAIVNWQAMPQEDRVQINNEKITQYVIDTIKLYADSIDYSDIFAEEDDNG